MPSPAQPILHYLLMLTPSAKREAAENLRRMARELERQAEADARLETVAAAVKRHRQGRADLINQMARMIAQQAPLAAVANRWPDLSPRQVQAFYDRARPLAGRILKMERDREICRAAGRGATNAELSQRFGISESQVTRIITAQWRRKLATT